MYKHSMDCHPLQDSYDEGQRKSAKSRNGEDSMRITHYPGSLDVVSQGAPTGAVVVTPCGHKVRQLHKPESLRVCLVGEHQYD